MALITATVGPSDDIRTHDFAGSSGRNCGFEIDGVGIYLGRDQTEDITDAAVIATACNLIDALSALRDAAMARLAESATAEMVEAVPA